jgi:hypothetical protein
MKLKLLLTLTLICALLTVAYAQTTNVSVTLTTEERAAIKWAADQQGQTVPVYLQARVSELARSYASAREASRDRLVAERAAKAAASVRAQLDAIDAKARADKQAIIDALPTPTPTPTPTPNP